MKLTFNFLVGIKPITIEIESRQSNSRNTPTISINDLNSAARIGIEFVKQIDTLEITLKEKNLLPKANSIEFLHQNFFGSNPDVVDLSRNGMIALQTTIEIVKK